ncbi:MAG: CHC2 zinc finger domain-containing protein [Alphaproteobacteria bacterium]
MNQVFVDFRHVKAHADFGHVLSHYGLKPVGKGSQKSIRCPFHDDKNPSCNVNLNKNVFHCFACGAKGNVLEFVAKKEGVDLRSAALLLADWCGFEPAKKQGSEPAPKAQKQPSERSQEVKRPDPQKVSETHSEAPSGASGEANSSAPPVLTFSLKLDPSHPYLRERGLTEEEIELFGLGFAGRGLMKGRIAIPIHDADGKLVAYAGRSPGEPPEGQPKYRFPDGFQKSRVLFNIHRVPEGCPEVVLVEGFFGAIAVHRLGIPVVAMMGSSVSGEQLRLLAERGVEFLKILCDGDEPGQEASAKIAAQAANQFYVRHITLPKGEQPDTALAAIAQTGEQPLWLEELLAPPP